MLNETEFFSSLFLSVSEARACLCGCQYAYSRTNAMCSHEVLS